VRHPKILWITIIFSLLAACLGTPAEESSPPSTIIPTPQSYGVIEIPLSGPIADARAELSGLDWYQDSLVFLPQYPERFGTGSQAALFKLERATLEAYLNGDIIEPLEPSPIAFQTFDIPSRLTGYEGFEAIAFKDQQVFLTIEASGGLMGEYSAFLVSGSVSPGLAEISLDPDSLVQVPSQVDLLNSTDEALLIDYQSVLSFHEANGEGINPDPVVNRYDLNLHHVGKIPFPHVDYRITDVSQVSQENAFWVINYFFPGDIHLIPAGAQIPSGPIERILEFNLEGDTISLAAIPPVELIISEEGARNWEGLARLDNRGFLLVTDQHPRTIFGYVEYPSQ
jgi:hypothetical protein